MATAEATICNKALARLGIKTQIEDLETPDVEEAATCKLFYSDTRDACLAAFPWPFATLRKELAQIATTDEPQREGWAYVYEYPTGCLRAWRVWPKGNAADLRDLYGSIAGGISLRAMRSDQRLPFAIEKSTQHDGKVILCDLTTPVLFYTAQVTDVGKFPALFADALAWLLASEMALALTGKEDRQKVCLLNYRAKISEARADALGEQQEDPPPDSELVAVRQ